MSVPEGVAPIKLPRGLRMQGSVLRFLSRRSAGTVSRVARSAPPNVRGRAMDPIVHLISVNSKKNKPVHMMTPPEARNAMELGFAVLDQPPREMASITEHDVPVEGGAIKAYVYRPKAEGPLPVVCFYHQGGCCIGSPRVVHSYCTQLAEELPAVVVNVGYRRIPEHPFPTPVEDGLASYRWAREHAAELGGDPDRMAVAGDSAGGLLSAYITHRIHDAGEKQPVGQLLIYPWLSLDQSYPSYTDLGSYFPLDTKTMEWFRSHAGSEDQAKYMHISPVHRDSLEGLAPAVIGTAGYCPLVDEGDHYAERLKEAGVPVVHKRYDSLCHSFAAMAGAVPAARAACDELTAEFRNILHG